MNYRVKIDEFSQFCDSQLINAHQCGEVNEYRAFLVEMNKKLAEVLSKTYQLEQNSPTMGVAPTQHDSRKRERKVAMNTSLPFIHSQSMQASMPSKRVKERAIISLQIFFGLTTVLVARIARE